MRQAFLVLTAVLVLLCLHCTSASGARKKLDASYFSGAEAKLEAAVRADDRTAIGAAIEAGANVSVRGVHNITPLMLAVDRLKHNAVAELLARRA